MPLPLEQLHSAQALAAVPRAVEAIEKLNVSERLQLLWAVYETIEGLVRPVFPESGKLSGRLSHQVANLPPEEQVQFLQDLLSQVKTPLTQDYGILSSNAKLAFWYRLAQKMRSGKIISLLKTQRSQLSPPACAALNQVVNLQLSQQIAVLRLVMGKMGINPLAA